MLPAVAACRVRPTDAVAMVACLPSPSLIRAFQPKERHRGWSYRKPGQPVSRHRGRLNALTDRERDVLRLMARGACNREIAARLHLAGTTIKTHVGALFGELGARDRAAAIVFAYDAGLVSPRI